jgi:hypothetical protein
VTGSLPDGRVGDDGGVKTFDIVAGLDHFTPPESLDSSFHAATVGTVIPETIEPAVNFGTGENESAPFAQTDNLVHQFLTLEIVGHDKNSLIFSYVKDVIFLI